MSDSVAGAAAWLGGTEIVNDARTTAYLRNGIKPNTLNVLGDCGCENILELAGCDDEYTNPAKDNAPWYDPAIPESAEFAGFLTTEFEGLNSTYTRTVTESIGDGASLGRSRFGSRTLTWKGYLFGSSCCGVAYGLRWLGKALQGGKNCGNNCYGDDLELLVCCPTMDAALGLGPNLICNSQLDHDTSFWASSGDTSITWHNRLVYSGEGAMRVVNPVGGAITFNTADCVMSVIPGKNYKMTIRLVGAPGVASESIAVTFSWYNHLGELISTSIMPDIGLDDDADWVIREATATSPLEAETVRLDFTIGDGSTPANEARYIDEVKLNQVNYAPIVDPFRTLKGVSLVEGPIINNQRKMGSSCGGRCGGAATMEIEFSLAGAQPWLYSAPIPVVNCVDVASNSVNIIGGVPSGLTENNPLIAGASTAQSVGFIDLPVVNLPNNIFLTLDPGGTLAKREVVLVTGHVAGSNTVTIQRAQQGTLAVDHPINTPWVMQAECGADNCGHGLLSQAPGYEGCAPPALPPSAIYVGCATPDTNNWQAVYITAPRAMWNSLSEVVPVITIETGGLPLVGARLGFYTSADGNPCGDLINTPPQCDLICDTLYISAIPGNSKFYIDGRTNKMSLVCGTNSVFPGEPYTLGPFSWPAFDCYGFCMEFAYDPLYESGGLCVSLSLVPRTTL